MLAYSFSIFARGFLAFSGFLVFIFTASLFGAEGRGTIGFGISIFASVGTLLSFSLGRVYLARALEKPETKEELLFQCIVINLLSSLLTLGLGILYWLVSPSAQSVVTFQQIVAFSLTSFFYVWSNNGHHFYSFFVRTRTQDFIIFISRLVLISFITLLALIRIENINHFIWGYSFILLFGTLAEMIILKKIARFPLGVNLPVQAYLDVARRAFWPHLDYISFNTFPLLLMVISASYLAKDELGRVNFACQMINLVFLLATTANLRVTSYVAIGGVQKRLKSFKTLLVGTALISAISASAIYYALEHLPDMNILKSFEGTSDLFLVSTLAIPGFTLFQFLNPIWIEINKLKVTAKLETLNLLLCLALTPFFLERFEVFGFMWLFAIFYILTFIIHFSLYLRYFKINP